MSGAPPSSSGGIPPSELAAMLRKSADVVERKEFHPLLYQTMRALTAYAGEYAEGSIKAAAPPSSSSAPSAAAKDAQQRDQKSRRRDAPGSEANKKERDRGDPPGKTQVKPGVGGKSASAFQDVPDHILDPNAGKSKKGGGHLKSSMTSTGIPSARTNNPSQGKFFHQDGTQRGKGVFSLKGIKKGIEKIGADILLGDNERTFDTSKDDIPFDELPRKNGSKNDSTEKQRPGAAKNAATDSAVAQHQQQQTSAQTLRQSQTANTTSSNPASDPEKPAKPCFQRPINPNSNLIANGWIDQQRRSKMRVVWKDVLASLVEGRRPGEETTLWIQRQVMNAATGKVTGLEALHQIPMKWLEDVSYVDIYGDHRFTLKVYNIAEEFYFRTRDEQSAQSWVLTLRSARDASLESNVRMLEPSASGENGNVEKRPSAKDMGLHDLDDWDVKKQNSNEGIPSNTPLAQASGDGGADNRPSPSPTPPVQEHQKQQPQPAAPVRKPVSELRAIAHGAGYNTRGMERQDLERIAAYVQSGSYNPNPPATAPPATSSGGPNKPNQSTQQEAARREAAQRAAAERREKDQQAQEDAAARRQKENEERAAVDKMRREREATEQKRVEEQMAAAEQQRRNLEFEQKAADIKRQQEEDRHRKMAELQAAERARQQQQAQAAAAAERQKRDEEEQLRRQQQQQQQQAEEQLRRQQQQQQQQQAEEQLRRQHPSSIPSPPTSGNYPQGNFQPQQQQQQQWGQQQQQHYQQWQQHQQQQQAHFQQQGFPGQQQAHPQQHPHHQQFFNQQQAAYQQQHPHHQQQNAHFQQQQQHQQHAQQPSAANAPPNSKYAQQMEEKNDEEDQSAVTLQIKRSILINWALQPPNLNVLRPIDQLVTTIHTAMPPAFGVTSHAYFAKFTPITQNELVLSAAMGNHPDETKLKKAVRKVRVFLHPDKLPRDLTNDQQFTARMLWDITSDSWEEFQKHKDELDWMK